MHYNIKETHPIMCDIKVIDPFTLDIKALWLSTRIYYIRSLRIAVSG